MRQRNFDSSEVANLNNRPFNRFLSDISLLNR